MPQDIDLALAIYHINPKARYRLSSSAPPHTIIEWRGPGPQPTQAELEAAWAVVSDPDWIDPNLPPGQLKAAQARKALKATQVKALKSVPELREAVALILEALEIEYAATGI